MDNRIKLAVEKRILEVFKDNKAICAPIWFSNLYQWKKDRVTEKPLKREILTQRIGLTIPDSLDDNETAAVLVDYMFEFADGGNILWSPPVIRQGLDGSVGVRMYLAHNDKGGPWEVINSWYS